MNLNFIDGIHDKTRAGLQTILLSQAKVRVYVALPVILCDLILFLITPGGIHGWFIALTAGYCAYALSPYWTIRNGSFASLKILLIATAISDPLVLSIWIAMTGVYGSLIAGFYLFTTLGFGFRTGRPLMHLCQITSIIGFCVVLAGNSFWQEHAVIWTALLIPLLVVPLYAGLLIKVLREAREHAEQESRAKSDLLAKVSHELRTPLTGIVASAELLAAESNDRVVTRRTDTILKLSDTLLCEINDLLDEAKYDAQSIELSSKPVDLHQKIAMLRTTFETMAAKKGLTFRAETDPAVHDLVNSDTHHLDRILLNLAGNAVKFTEKGSVKLAIDLVEETQSHYRLRFSVTDTGIGIPEAFHAKIFEPFSQVDQGESRRYGGTGLGLALSKKIISLMGGDLRFESTLGKGSRFWFELTLGRAGPAVAAVVEEIRPGFLSARRILVAEDNLTNLLLLEELLKIDRHEVTTCDSGMAALELLATQEFDVLLLDYNLGDMDGVRVLQTYRFGRLNPAPALFLTADATMQTATRLKDAGGAGVLYKPINLAGIRKALAQIEVRTPAAGAEQAAVVATEAAKPSRPALTVVPINALDESILDELKAASTRPDFLPMLLAHAESDITRSCQQLQEALADHSYASIRSAAHALKGVSANVGAVRLATLASTLMRMSSDELDTSSDKLGADIRESSQAAIHALKKVIGEHAPALAGNTGSLHLD
jgi:two-component system, sensor histidine kinase RpfC